MGHNGKYEVRAPGSSPVRFPTRRRARRVARQVQGASVRRSGCLFGLFFLFGAGLHRREVR